MLRSILGFLIRTTIPLAILAVGVGAYILLSHNPEEVRDSPQKERRIRTRVTDLSVQNYQVVVKAQGIVQAHNEITLSAQVSGQIKSLSPNFEAGSHFSAGEVLVELDARDYQNEVDIAAARLESARSAVEIAEAEYESYQELFRKNFTSQAELNRYTASRAQATASLDSAVAQLEQARLDLDRTKIRAPFDGRVRQKHVGVGQSIGSGTSLGSIFAVDYAEVRLPLSATDRRYLKLPETEGADPVPVELRDAIHPDPLKTWDAQIVRTEGTLDAGSLELMAIARIQDPFGLRTGHSPLRIGQPVTGYISGEVLRDVVPIPRPAVRELNQIILIDKADLRLSKVTINPIWSDEEHIIVPHTSLYDDKLLATTHIVYAPEGAQVEIIPSMDDPVPDEMGAREAGA